MQVNGEICNCRSNSGRRGNKRMTASPGQHHSRSGGRPVRLDQLFRGCPDQVEGVEGSGDLCAKTRAGVRQSDRTPFALDQPRAETLFQIGNMAGDHGGTDRKRRGGRAHATVAPTASKARSATSGGKLRFGLRSDGIRSLGAEKTSMSGLS